MAEQQSGADPRAVALPEQKRLDLAERVRVLESALDAALAQRAAQLGEAVEDLTLQICFDKAVKDRDAAQAQANMYREAWQHVACERAASERALAAARDVLRRLEWSKGIQTRQDYAHRDACPVCGGWDPRHDSDGQGHTPDCALATILSSNTGDTP